MDIREIEEQIIQCIKANIELSDEPVPEINAHTAPLRDINGFDSMRTLEVLVDISEKLDCELPANTVFTSKDPKSMEIGALARNIQKLMEDSQK